MHIQGNGISIHYQIDGPENAPTVVLSHSLAANLEMWDAQMSTLLPDFRVLRYDTRGHGQTEVPTGSYTLELLARDLFSLMAGLLRHYRYGKNGLRQLNQKAWMPWSSPQLNDGSLGHSRSAAPQWSTRSAR